MVEQWSVNSGVTRAPTFVRWHISSQAWWEDSSDSSSMQRGCCFHVHTSGYESGPSHQPQACLTGPLDSASCVSRSHTASAEVLQREDLSPQTLCSSAGEAGRSLLSLAHISVGFLYSFPLLSSFVRSSNTPLPVQGLKPYTPPAPDPPSSRAQGRPAHSWKQTPVEFLLHICIAILDRFLESRWTENIFVRQEALSLKS